MSQLGGKPEFEFDVGHPTVRRNHEGPRMSREWRRPMPRTRPLRGLRGWQHLLILVSLLCSTTVTFGAVGAVGAVEPSQRLALLIGCTQYPYLDAARMLRGPANDVPAFARLLEQRFGFPKPNVHCLVGWPKDESRRPTSRNISVAFENLVRRSEPGVQIVITLSGHGTQIPIPDGQLNALDPMNPEPDGLDEAFLPADVRPGLEHAIRDNQFAVWLQQMKQRGASVWIVFDCCHSGTLTRSGVDRESHRGLDAWDVGVSIESISKARSKVRVTGDRHDQGPLRIDDRGDDRLDLVSEESVGGEAGSVTAFFAAQSHEKAPDLVCPDTASARPENYFGLLSFTLIQTLSQSSGRLSYRDLGRLVAARYRAERGSRGPTPMFAGDLDRDVIGVRKWPAMPIYLERVDGKTRLSVGSLGNMTRGSILAVHPAAGSDADFDEVLAYLQVTRVAPTLSEVASVSFAEISQPVRLSQLPSLARCRLVVRDIGDVRVAISVAKSDGPANPSLRSNIMTALEELPAEVGQLLNCQGDETRAQWVLRLVDPREARLHYGLDVRQPSLLLLAGKGRVSGPPLPKDQGGQPRGLSPLVPPHVYAVYSPSDPVELAELLARDLRKIFSWQNLWRVAGTLEPNSASATGLELQVLALGDARNTDRVAAVPAGNILRSGQQIELQIRNATTQDMWMTLVYLDANLGIHVWYADSIKRKQSFRPLVVEIDDDSLGPEGIVVLAAPFALHKNQPDYRFLAQQPLGTPDGPLVVARDVTPTPFGRLAAAIKAESPIRTRSHVVGAPSNPQILAFTWFSVPAPSD